MSRLLHTSVVVCGTVATAVIVEHQFVGVSLIENRVWSSQGRHGGHEADENSCGVGILHDVWDYLVEIS